MNSLFEFFLENTTGKHSISKETRQKINDIYNGLAESEKAYLGDSPISKYTVYARVMRDSYIVLDDYKGKFKDEHPYKGLIISMAASKKDRGTSLTDHLLRSTMLDNAGKTLIAEIDVHNKPSMDLVKRVGMKQFASQDGLVFYKGGTKL